MVPSARRSFAWLTALSVLLGAASKLASAQSRLSAPTATTQIFDFRVADGVWEDSEQTFIDGAGIEQTVNAGPELEVIDIATRPVSGQTGTGTALDGLTAAFKGLSQNADGVLRGHNRTNPNRGEDFVVETFFNSTSIKQFSRYGQSVENENGRAGALQWGFDLSPLDVYLANEGLALDNLEVNLRANWQALQGRDYDLLLSYTNASEGIILGDISTQVGTEERSFPGSETNWHVLFKPSRTGSVGDLIGDDPRTTGEAAGDYNNDDIVDAADYTLWRDTLDDTVTNGEGADGDGNGVIEQADYAVWRDNYGAVGGDPVIEPNTHKVVVQGVRADADEFTADAHITTIDLLDLYNQGIREFNLVAVAAGFGDNRNFGVAGPNFDNPNDLADPLTFGSGVYINTSPAGVGAAKAAPEPAAASLLLVAAGHCLWRRR